MVDKKVKEKFNSKRDGLGMSNSKFLDYLVDHLEGQDHIIQFRMDDMRYNKLKEYAKVLVKSDIINDNSMDTVIDYIINNFIVAWSTNTAVGGMEVG